MNKLIRVLAVLLLASMVCLVSIIGLSLASDLVDAEPSVASVVKNDPKPSDVPEKLADGEELNTEVPLPPTAVPIIPTAEPTEDILNIAYLLQAWDYFDSLGILAQDLIDDLLWITENIQFSANLEDIYALCTVGEENMSDGIEALSNLDPTDDLKIIHAMYLSGFGEWRLGMQACQAGDILSFGEHTEAGLTLVSTANDLVDIWEPEE